MGVKRCFGFPEDF
jgi:hypothetical protein